MEISYLAPCKGSLRITVTPFNHLQSGQPPSSRRQSRSSDEDDLTYSPVSDPVDSFRVLIRGKHVEEGGGVKQHKGKKSNQIYAQGMIILY
jgi:hypothetical protein